MKQESKPLTKKQKTVLEHIQSFILESGIAPTLRDIAKFLKTKNLSTAQYYVEELDEKGYLERDPHKSRGITLKNTPNYVQRLGLIAAGEPIEPIENPEPIEVPANIKMDRNHSHYALQVKGDSMMDMGILDGDTVLVRHQMTAQNGDTVVAITEKGATLKVYKRKNGHVVLGPRNKTMKPIIPRQLEIRGVMVGLIRNEKDYNG